MSLETGESTSLQTSESLSSWQVWKTIFTHPKVESYQTLIDDPKAGFKRGLIWTGLSNLLCYTVLMLPPALFFGTLALSMLFRPESMALGLLMVIMAAALIPVLAGWAVVSVLIQVGICHLVARKLGGTGQYEKLFFLSPPTWPLSWWFSAPWV
ncbi:MAG: hypothetical protein AB9891_07155 [Anaerolineaceae bacterium]